MKLYLDTEFNGFNGDLISLALVGEGVEWYRSLGCSNPCDFVRDHVLPVIDIPPEPRRAVQRSLSAFLLQWKRVTIVADWPEDIKLFCHLLIDGPGQAIDFPELNFELQRVGTISAKPHNALADARGLMQILVPDTKVTHKKRIRRKSGFDPR